jgi:hypothetical protein
MAGESGGTNTPLGRPVVPLEYSMSVPADSSAMRAVGCAETAASQDA